MAKFMHIRVWDVEHGCCVTVQPVEQTNTGGVTRGKLAMIDSGSSEDFRPSDYIRTVQKRDAVDYLFITNADQDHMSDLHGLAEAGIAVKTLFRNKSYTGEQMRAIKREGGALTKDAQWYTNACDRYNSPASEPFNEHMGGITCRVFSNKYPEFQDTNNLSLVVFIKFAGFKMLFPGDLEKAGWAALLKDRNFCEELKGTTVLMASHHGRENGFCEDAFNYFTPDCVVKSDKPKEHESQETYYDYKRVVSEDGVFVSTSGRRRHVLTTRNDGWIEFLVREDGQVTISTENEG